MDDAVKRGALDLRAHGAAIAAARKLAKVLDAPGWPEMPSGKVDNVTPTTFLRERLPRSLSSNREADRCRKRKRCCATAG